MEAQLQKACAALKTNRTEVMKKKKKGDLFATPTTVQLLVQFADNQELPEAIETHKVTLPKPMFSLESTDACLITRPPQRKVKDALRTAAFPHRIQRVIDIRKLKRKFKSYAEREKLHKSYTLFLADRHITKELPELLGRDFMFKAKMPVPVSVPYKPEELKDSLASGFSTAMFHVAKKSAETTVGIGNTDQDETALAQNGKAVIEYLKTVPAFANNIYSIRVKTQHSPALLVYQNTDITTKDPKEAGKKKRKREEKAEENDAPNQPKATEEDTQAPPTRKQKAVNGKPVAVQAQAAQSTPAQKVEKQVAAAKQEAPKQPAAAATTPKASPKAAKTATSPAPTKAATPAATPAAAAATPAAAKGAAAPKAAGKGAAKSGKAQQQAATPAARSASAGSVGSPKPAGKKAWK